MKLLDTNVPISATSRGDPLQDWAQTAIKRAVAHGGAAINAVTLAELCACAGGNSSLLKTLETWGVEFLDVPTNAAPICGAAYAKYLANRKASSATPAPRVPLPDFFIGAHAEVMGWELITNDDRKFKTYFPALKSEQPPRQAAT